MEAFSCGRHYDVLAYPNFYSLGIQFLFVSTNYAVWLTSVYGSPQATLPLALLTDTTPRIRDFNPLGLFCFENYIYHSRHTHYVKCIKTHFTQTVVPN